MPKADRREWLVLLFCIFLMIIVFVSGVFDKRKTWGTMEWANLDFIEQTPENPQYGIQNTGPAFNLPQGQYELKFCIETDGEGFVRLSTTNDAPISPNAFPFSADQYEQVVSFEVQESAKQVDIQIDFESGTYYKMGETRLYTPFYKDNAFTLLFFVIGVWVLIITWRHRNCTAEQCISFFLICIAVLFASAPALKENLSVFHDTRYHSARLRNLADGLASGQFPVRLGGFSYNGYGAITSVFYPDIFLYPFACFLLAGASLQYTMNLLLICCNTLSAITMYHCARRIWHSEKAGSLASILYVLSVYHITDGCVRFALGELLAMGFLPLFMMGLWEVIHGDQKKWYILGFGAACIFLSHMLSTFLCTLFAFAIIVTQLRNIFSEHRIFALFKALTFSIAISAFHIIPLLMYSGQGIGADASLFTTTMAGTTISPAQLFLLGSGNLSKLPTDSTLSFMPLEIGAPLLIGVGLMMGYAFESPCSEWKDRIKNALLFTAVGVWFVFMSTTLFPWSYVSVVTDLFDKVQFAYRYLMFPAFLFSLVSATAYERIGTQMPFSMVAVFVLSIAVAAVLPTITEQTRHYEYYEFGLDVSPDIKQFTEYCLPGIDMKQTRYREIETEGDILLFNKTKRGSTFLADIETRSDSKVTLPLFAFDGYVAYLDNESIKCEKADTGKLMVEIPANKKGTLKVLFKGKRIWLIGDILSLITIIISSICFIRRRRSNVYA